MLTIVLYVLLYKSRQANNAQQTDETPFNSSNQKQTN